MSKEKLDKRLVQKSRTVWLATFIWALVTGVLFYLLYVRIDLLASYLILLILTFALVVFVGYSLRATTILFRICWSFPFSQAVVLILNQISPQWISKNIIGNVFVTTLSLMAGTVLVCLVAIPIIRLTIGQEVIPANPMSIFGYLVECKSLDSVTLLKDFLRYIGVKSIKVTKENNQTYAAFTKYPNEYIVSLGQKNKSTEFGFVVYQLKYDTVIKANKEDSDIFFGAFNGILDKWKENGKIDSWKFDSEPKSAETLMQEVLQEYTSPITLRIPFPSRENFKERTVGWLRRNRTEIMRTLISGIILAIIVQIIIHFLFS